MLLRKPEEHFISHKDGELLLELDAAFRFRETASNCHYGRREQSFSRQRAHEFLEVGCKSEGHWLRVIEVGFVGDHGWYKLRAPDIARRTRDGEFVGEPAGHVHDVRHECKGCELVGELAAEKEEVGIRGIGCLEIIQCDCIRDPFALDSSKNLCAKGMILGLVHLVRYRGPKSFHSRENGFVLVLVIAPTVVFVNALK